MKPSIPKGTRDFSPVEMVRRNFIFKTIREVFEKYGYQPIETPAMENLETLTGKYGDEGDKLIFKILNSGHFLSEVPFDILREALNSISQEENEKIGKVLSGKSGQEISRLSLKDLGSEFESQVLGKYFSEKVLRYDLTVPFARYVVQHQNEITFPFKRYQIQPVWRADKPQKGRYREFYQCDADVIGSDSLLNEVDLVQMIIEVFLELNISIEIKINNRKILTGMAEVFGVKDKFMDLIVAMDKYEKIGNSIYDELKEKGFSDVIIKNVKEFVDKVSEARAAGTDKFFVYLDFFTKSEIAVKGFDELKIMSSLLGDALSGYSKEIQMSINYNLLLARGLTYYTGAIFEVKANGVQIGSICGGGRYDDLTGIFGLPNVSGVGISFGIDRIFDVMNELNLFDSIGLTASTTKVMLAHFGEEERKYCIGVASQLRSAGINTEIYPDVTKKIAKQFDYANKKNIPFVVVIGEEEMNDTENRFTFKDMSSGEQSKMKVEAIISKLK